MPRFPIVGGNWKCNLTVRAAKELARALAPIDTSKCEVVVAPIAMHIPLVKDAFSNGIKLAAQNCGFTGVGAYTGEIAADHIVDMGLEWVVLGHSERRALFQESDELLAKKLAYAQQQGLKCIFCIGEQKEERQNGTTMDVCIRQMRQITSLLDPAKVVIAYEPVWAIGTGLTATPEQAQETHRQIRGWIASNVSAAVADTIRIQYGGSVKASNAPELAKQPDIDGFLVGGASLKPDFNDICKATAEAKAGARSRL